MYLDKRIQERLDRKRKMLNALRPLPESAVKKLREQFELEMTYNSNAIEGNSLTLKETFLVISEGLTIKGKPLRDHLEAKNHTEALAYLFDLIDHFGIAELMVALLIIYGSENMKHDARDHLLESGLLFRGVVEDFVIETDNSRTDTDVMKRLFACEETILNTSINMRTAKTDPIFVPACFFRRIITMPFAREKQNHRAFTDLLLLARLRREKS